LGTDWIIVGLGNPGEEYSQHRHNLGFMVLDALALKKRCSWRSNRKKGKICDMTLAGRKALLLKPQTYMNLSGEAVRPIVTPNKFDPSKLILVHDDLDLAEGRVRIKIGGGHGGHKGVASVADCLASENFVRVRLGIGRPPAGVDPTEFVLTPFDEHDEQAKKDLIQDGLQAVRLIVSHGVERAQNVLHSQNKTSIPEG
jgi:PTH1 family peptidyl-tRNA hydrolase